MYSHAYFSALSVSHCVCDFKQTDRHRDRHTHMMALDRVSLATQQQQRQGKRAVCCVLCVLCADCFVLCVVHRLLCAVCQVLYNAHPLTHSLSPLQPLCSTPSNIPTAAYTAPCLALQPRRTAQVCVCVCGVFGVWFTVCMHACMCCALLYLLLCHV